MMSCQIEKIGSTCVGCGACAAACPFDCIAMAEDDHGFRHPLIDHDRCCSCGKCGNACPALTPMPKDSILSVWWAYTSNTVLRLSSSSGGVFGELAHEVIAGMHGIVIGAVFDAQSKAVYHYVAETLDELPMLLTSKYVQSNISREVFQKVKRALQENTTVLFCGTGCQIAGLKRYLGNLQRSEYLYTVDVVCHGVPSPGLFRKWLAYVEESQGQRVCSIIFRDKKSGWTSYSVTYEFENGKHFSHLASEDWYMRAFLNNASLRPSCFDCIAKGACGSDLTLGDYWGIRSHHPQVSNALGVSCVIVHTENGSKLISSVGRSTPIGESSIDCVASGNSSVARSSRPFAEYEEFQGLVADGRQIENIMTAYRFRRPIYRRALSIAAALANAWRIRREAR